MSITTYAELQSAIGNWLDHSLFSARIPEFIALFEACANRRLRVRQQEATTNLTPDANGNATLPADYLALRRVTWTGSPRVELQYVSSILFAGGLSIGAGRRAAHLHHRRINAQGAPARSNRARDQLFPENPGARDHRSQLALDRASRSLPLRLDGGGGGLRRQRRARAAMESAARRDLRRDRQAQQQDARRRSRRRARDGNNAVTGILDLRVFDPEREGLLARLGSRADSSGLLSRLPPGPARDVVQLAWRGLQELAPNLTNPATYAPLPPPAWTPTPEGKLPSSDRDPRLEGIASDLVNIAMLLGPQWEAGLAARAARLLR